MLINSKIAVQNEGSVCSDRMGSVCAEYPIKVESKEGIKKKDYEAYMEQMRTGEFIVGKAKKTFSEFSKKEASIKNEKLNKTSSFDLSRKFDIQPTIYLDSSKVNFIGRKIDFESLKKYCKTVLEEIEKEVYGR